MQPFGLSVCMLGSIKVSYLVNKSYVVDLIKILQSSTKYNPESRSDKIIIRSKKSEVMQIV